MATAGLFSGTISGDASNLLVKVDSGTQYLYGANTYAGGTTVTGGTLVAGSARGSGHRAC